MYIERIWVPIFVDDRTQWYFLAKNLTLFNAMQKGSFSFLSLAALHLPMPLCKSEKHGGVDVRENELKKDVC